MSVRRDSLNAWLLAALAPFLSLLIVRPWLPGAFPVYDFCDLLPVFRSAHGFWDTLEAFAAADRPNGLARYVGYSQLTLTWLIAGENPVAWQLMRALFMLVAAVLIVVAARRVGASPLVAGIAALLFTIAVPSTEGWLFLMGEPFGLLVLLLIFLVGAGYTTTPAWKSRAVLLAVLAYCVMNSKEVIAVLLPVLVLFAVCWVPGQGFRRPLLGPRERWLGVLLLGVLILQVWLMRSALQEALPGAYATTFGRDGLDLQRISTRFQSMLLPARYSSASASTILYPANLAFLLLLLLGLVKPENNSARPKDWVWWTVGLLSVPAVGALTYSFWPRYSAFYGIPFWAGSTGLFILAGTGIERSHRAGRWVVVILGVAAIGYTAIPSARTVRDKRAIADLAATIVKSFPLAPRLDTLYVVAPKQGGRRWPITGSELQRYAAGAMQVPASTLPVVHDASCEEIVARLQRPLGNNAVLNDQNPCGRLPAATRTWLEEVRYLDWLSLRPRADTILVEILAPTWTSARGRP